LPQEAEVKGERFLKRGKVGGGQAREGFEGEDGCKYSESTSPRKILFLKMEKMRGKEK